MNLLINPETCGKGRHALCDGSPCECPCGHDRERLAIDLAVAETEHAFCGGWEPNAAFEVVCTADGTVILRAGEARLS